MILKDGGAFVAALELQRCTREARDESPFKAVRARKHAEYLRITAAIEDYIKNMNSKGERDDIKP